MLSAAELDAALGMKPGEVANGRKLDKGLSEVQKAYGKSGHMAAHTNPTAQFDDAAAKVTFKIAVDEGPQYHMGTVEFKGFSADDTFILNKRWGLRSGEVYDQTYAVGFLRDVAGEILSRMAKAREAQGKPMPNVSINEYPNAQTLTVNLVIQVKD